MVTFYRVVGLLLVLLGLVIIAGCVAGYADTPAIELGSGVIAVLIGFEIATGAGE